MERFKTILLDPPWPERGGGKIKRGADRHYAVMTIPQIIEAIVACPLWRPDRDGCGIWMWATANHLMKAGWVFEELGVTYVTNVVWNKTGRVGLGQRVRMQHEHLLFGRMGNVPIPPPVRRWPSVQSVEREKKVNGRSSHSAKPSRFHELIEAHGPDGPRAELFGRGQARPGWMIWGLEAEHGLDAVGTEQNAGASQ